MAVKNSVLPITRSSVSVNGSYQAFTALPQACFLIRILNESNASIDISFDGSTDADRLMTNSVLQINAQANSQPNNYIANFAKNQIIYVKGAGAGNVYLVGYYQPSAG